MLLKLSIKIKFLMYFRWHKLYMFLLCKCLCRNKEEGYFIASDLLKKIFTEKTGVEAVHKLPALLKRLRDHVEELSRKAKPDKRSALQYSNPICLIFFSIE